MVGGDSVCHGKRYDVWDRFFFHPARNVLATTPFYLVPGNHEENSEWFYEFVGYSEPKNYHAFRYGNAHFIGLDSTAVVEHVEGGPRLIEGSFEPGAPQYDFLTRVGDRRRSGRSSTSTTYRSCPRLPGRRDADPVSRSGGIRRACGVQFPYHSIRTQPPDPK